MHNESFLLNLPAEVIIETLSRLPVPTVLTCRCVCKKWLKLISTPEFTNSHLLHSTPGLIVYLSQRGETVCSIYEFEDALGLQRHDLHYKPVMKFNPNMLSSSPKANIGLECSFNGLLCLRDDDSELDSLYICNPITHEYIPLPANEGNARDPNMINLNIVTYGIGISALSGQYKVVRILHKRVTGSKTGSRLSGLQVECMVYTLGTGSWRSVESNEVYEYNPGPPCGAFLNGNVHWFVEDAKGCQAISCFDLETEVFKPFPPPPFEAYQLMTLVGECLCVCDFGADEEIVIWMMKEYGVEGSWTKVCTLILVG